jgi:hypothetical protein
MISETTAETLDDWMHGIVRHVQAAQIHLEMGDITATEYSLKNAAIFFKACRASVDEIKRAQQQAEFERMEK